MSTDAMLECRLRKPETDRIDLKQLAKELAEDERERLVHRPSDWPPERFIDYSFEPFPKSATK